MGICDFYSEAKGKTPESAFNKAVAIAKKRYGNGSHTGSIAEKEQFIVLKDTVKDVADKILEKKIILEEKLRRKEEFEVSRFEIKREIIRIKREKNAFDSRPKKIGKDKAYAIAYALVILEDERINTPEKPAGAIQCTKGNWLFFGFTNE